MLLSPAWTRSLPFTFSYESFTDNIQTLFDNVPKDSNMNVTGWLVYDNAKQLPNATLVETFDDFNDFELVPYDQKPLLLEPDQSITLDVIMNVLGDGEQ